MYIFVYICITKLQSQWAGYKTSDICPGLSLDRKMPCSACLDSTRAEQSSYLPGKTKVRSVCQGGALIQNRYRERIQMAQVVPFSFGRGNAAWDLSNQCTH